MSRGRILLESPWLVLKPVIVKKPNYGFKNSYLVHSDWSFDVLFTYMQISDPVIEIMTEWLSFQPLPPIHRQLGMSVYNLSICLLNSSWTVKIFSSIEIIFLCQLSVCVKNSFFYEMAYGLFYYVHLTGQNLLFSLTALIIDGVRIVCGCLNRRWSLMFPISFHNTTIHEHAANPRVLFWCTLVWQR